MCAIAAAAFTVLGNVWLSLWTDGAGTRWTVVGGQWWVDSGGWTVVGGQWWVDGGGWTVVYGSDAEGKWYTVVRMITMVVMVVMVAIVAMEVFVSLFLYADDCT
jgi:hypothetical protein